MTESPHRPTALIVGASRALGLGLATELAHRGWTVIGTVRGAARTGLHDLADRCADRVEVEILDVTEPAQIVELRNRLDGRALDLLFVNAAVTRGNVPAADVPAEVFAEVMVTNALSPMRIIDSLRDLVPPSGTIGVMSSSQGSISLNTVGGQDVYRASKAALNQLMRSHAGRHADDPRTLLLLNPGHVQTDLGGQHAPLTIEDSIPGVVDTITAHHGDGGLHFLDYHNQTVPW
ncbi:SDR family NAD(P)-dependent oxidoreductase [Speluncibacter jeojiensis]|uniref:SDR family oxidoreductase n=1 Tax=Speluncibacter jeojiensis TaxID=2710754 RepID=A0A9X4M6N6_9ACTN|nr:SDR family oxidoreductase [Corynebacteriales bacterium D3-21]